MNGADLILHIPHSGTAVPWMDGYTKPELVAGEIDLLTDWHTDRIYSIPEISTVCPGFSRVFCDVERFAQDEQEPMAALGMGFYYTRTDDDQEFRRPGTWKQRVLEEYWRPHHRRLAALTAEKLRSSPQVLILDCHSFSRIPFRREFDQAPGRPDVCLGTEGIHTPDWLVEAASAVWEEAGYRVETNRPYRGALVPTPWWNQEPNVLAIMVEINRRLYLTEDTGPGEIPGAVDQLNGLFRRMVARMMLAADMVAPAQFPEP